jgi:hypothetical protein
LIQLVEREHDREIAEKRHREDRALDHRVSPEACEKAVETRRESRLPGCAGTRALEEEHR